MGRKASKSKQKQANQRKQYSTAALLITHNSCNSCFVTSLRWNAAVAGPRPGLQQLSAASLYSSREGQGEGVVEAWNGLRDISAPGVRGGLRRAMLVVGVGSYPLELPSIT